MDALGKRKGAQQTSAKGASHAEPRAISNHDGRRFKKKLRHKQGPGSGHDDRLSKKVDWQSISAYFKRIIPKPPVEAWGTGLRILDQAIDPLWSSSDKECVSKSEYTQIVHYLQNKCNIYDLELSRPNEKHDNFITRILDEMISLADRPKTGGRSVKLLINFGNTAAWAIFDKTEATGSVSVQITSYVPLSSSEFEYLSNLFQYVAIAGGDTKSHVPVIGKFVRSNGAEAEAVSLGGFAWKAEPPNSPSQAIDEMANKYAISGLIQPNGVPNLGESRCFTGRQMISTLYELMAVETELQGMRSRILSQLCVENIYPYKLAHEPRVGQLITLKAKSAQRWSQFRRIITSAVDHYARQMSEETQAEPDQNADEPKLSHEYCSVCLMPEQAHKHVLIQCKRCRVRVHPQCYVVSPPPDAAAWLCDVCTEEGGKNETHVANRGICVICGSSGGALKRVDGDVSTYFTQLYSQGRYDSKPPASWIHIICGAWLIPSVSCRDWASLSGWDISNLRSSKASRCSVCMASLGFYATCRIAQCGLKMHPLCAWLGGTHATVRRVFSKSLPFNSSSDPCFLPFYVEPLCPFHSFKEFSQA